MTDGNSNDVLELSLDITARPATVFAFFADPASFQQWMGPGSALVPGVGGNFRIQYPDGNVAAGVVELLQPDKRIVMTWGYLDAASGIPPGSTRVEVVLEAVDGGTRVTLRHSGLDAVQRSRHRQGWTHYLSVLSQACSASLQTSAEESIRAYMAAWAERDSGARNELLQRCWEEGAVFRDPFGYVRGASALSDHIAVAQRFAQGMTLEQVSPLARSHGFVSYRWRMIGEGGKTMASGSNTAEMNADGRIRALTGFWEAT